MTEPNASPPNRTGRANPFTHLLSQMPALVAITRGPDHIVELVNEKYTRFFGEREYLGRRVGEVVPELEPLGHLAVINGVYRSGKIAHLREARVEWDAEGDVSKIEGFFDFSYQPLRTTSGEIVGVICFAIDVTHQVLARRDAERAQTVAENGAKAARLTADKAPVLLWTSGDDALSDWFNDAWLRYTGRALEHELGEGWMESVHSEDLERVMEVYLRAVQARESFTIEFRLRRHDGEYRWMLNQGVPRTTPDGTFVGYVGSLVDVTEQHEASTPELREAERVARAEAEAARAEAEAASRAKTELIRTISHEYRTPIHASLGFLELLDLGVHGSLNAAQRSDLNRIRANQRHLLALINDVLNLARIEAGAVEAETHPVQVRELVDSVEALVAPQIAQKSLEYAVQPVDPDLVALADADKARRVLLNLLSNAVKFTPPGGTVTVRCDGDDHWTRVHVRDTGPGIPQEKLGEIFEPFVQLSTTETASDEGSGLGLSISRQLAELQGGELTVESAPGAGSTFTLWLRRGNEAA